jgi:hypothetical protein
MKIGLYPCDSKMINLPLMKLSAWHKTQGDQAEIFNPLNNYDKVYISKIFDFSPLPTDIMCDNIEIGGTGYDLYKNIPNEIEILDPDYSIYPTCNYSIQLFSRGCPRKCKFCIVPRKEGAIRSLWPMNLNPNGKWIEVLDNNFFANNRWMDAIAYLIKQNQPINFHGIDARTLTFDMCISLMQLNHHKQIKMAWDNYEDRIDWGKITKIIPAWKIMVYVLIGFNSTPAQDLDRVTIIDSLGMDPFIMPFNKRDAYQKAFARWVNHKAIFKSVKWENYKEINHISGSDTLSLGIKV